MDENGGVRQVVGYVSEVVCLAFHDMHSFARKCEMLKQILCYLQSQLMPENMTNKGKQKAKIIDYDLDAEISPTPRVEIIYEDTKSITGAEPEFKWGEIYHMLVEKKVPEAGLEDLALNDNILRFGITKVSTRIEMFPCIEVIDGFFPKWMQQG